MGMIPSRTDLSQICISMEDFRTRNVRFRENRMRPYYIFSLIKLNEVVVCIDFYRTATPRSSLFISFLIDMNRDFDENNNIQQLL